MWSALKLKIVPAYVLKPSNRWIYAGRLLKGALHVLRHKGKRQKPAETRGKFAVGRPISQRPKDPAAAFQTATTDRDKEFACYANLEETHNVQIYFADPYSSWQRGSN